MIAMRRLPTLTACLLLVCLLFYGCKQAAQEEEPLTTLVKEVIAAIDAYESGETDINEAIKTYNASIGAFAQLYAENPEENPLLLDENNQIFTDLYDVMGTMEYLQLMQSSVKDEKPQEEPQRDLPALRESLADEIGLSE